MSEVIEMPNQEDVILASVQCVHCETPFIADLRRDAFVGPFDDGSGKGTRVQYAKMTCVNCKKPITVKIPYFNADEEKTHVSKIVLWPEVTIPLYLSDCLKEDENQ